MTIKLVLLIGTALLSLVSGILIFDGAKQTNRARAGWFLFMSIAISAWTAAMSFFISAKPGMEEFTGHIVSIIDASGLLLVIGFLGYSSVNYRNGRILTMIVAIIGALLLAGIIISPSSFHTTIILEGDVNYMERPETIIYAIYSIVLIVVPILMSAYLLVDVVRSRGTKVYKPYLTLYIGLLIAGSASVVFDVIMPTLGSYTYSWLGPLMASLVIACFCLSVIYCKAIQLSTSGIQRLFRGFFLIVAVIVYFSMLYGISVLISNRAGNKMAPWLIFIFANLIIGIILLIAWSFIRDFLRHFTVIAAANDIDVDYISKVLKRNIKKGIRQDPTEIAKFLAAYLHRAYFGFIIEGKLYGSSPLSLSKDWANQIMELGAAEKSVWQKIDAHFELELNRIGIIKVAELRNRQGMVYGQILLGKELDTKDGAETISRTDLEEILKLAAKAI